MAADEGAGESSSEQLLDSPVERASFFSWLLFLWIGPLINLGAKQTLEQDNLLPVGKQDAASVLCSRLETEWTRQLSKSKPSLLYACVSLVVREYLPIAAVVHGFSITMGFLQPFFLGKVIDYFTGNVDRADAYLYTLGFVLLGIVRALTYHTLYFVAQREVGMHLRVSLTSLVHKKVLQLHSSSLLKLTTGHIVNLVSTDVQRLDELCGWLSSAWWGIVAFIVTIVLVWYQLGVACFAGFALVCVNLVFQAISAKFTSKYRDQMAVLTDKRIRFMNEILTGVQLIKMYVWEMPFGAVITRVRDEELAVVRKRQYLWGFNSAIGEVGLHLILYLMFTTYVYLGNTLTPRTAFVTLATMQVFRNEVLYLQVRAFTTLSEGLVAIYRIQDFLLLAESKKVRRHGSPVSATNPNPPVVSGNGCTGMELKTGMHADKLSVTHSQLPEDQQPLVNVVNLTSSWEEDEESLESENGPFSLLNLNFHICKGELLIAVGAVGAGKTSLLMSLLGELHVRSGHCTVQGDVAYAAQLPWVFSGSVQDNIVFGRTFDADRYKSVVAGCCLDKDLQGMPYGDQTLVGERGVKLSGGQKARIGLARAVYQDADVYLLDDPLSAVDAEVGRLIFEKCICGMLKEKAVLLVTHQQQYLSSAARILVLDQGRSLGTWTYSELLASDLGLAKSLAKDTSRSEGERSAEDAGDPFSQNRSDDEGEVAEDRSIGSVKWEHYWKFFRAGANKATLLFAISIFIIAQASIITSDWWLANWTSNFNTTVSSPMNWTNASEAETDNNTTLTNQSGTDTTQRQLKYSTGYFVGVWSGLLALSVALATFRSVVIRQILVRSSKALHEMMLSSILKAPMLFFNTNPSGRILNRFAKDLNLLDILLPVVFYEFLTWFLVMCGFATFISYANPTTLIAVPPMAVAFVFLRRKYIRSSREIKRLEAVARSPVFSQFSSSLQGLTTIRAAGAQDQLQTKFNNLLDAHTRGWLCYLAVVRWLSCRLELLGAFYLSATSFAALLMFDYGNVFQLDAGTFGLTITYQIAFYGYIQWTVRMSADAEDLMTSSERILAYSELEAEREPALPVQLPENWPQHGRVTGEDVSYSYSPDGAAVLKELNFDILPGEKIGIVGRTGAGKSSFINALFRLAPTSGKVMIDGVELDKVLLSTMRQKLSIIPQDPVLYSGTLRYNLDPFSRYHDVYLWNALEMVELKQYVSQLNKGLEAELTEHGSNLSVGQRQLICLARALLNRNRILMIDEATANVDRQTDSIIQQTLRTHFKDCTVITIAHRLHTIIDSDRIMVIDSGRIKEFDRPFALLQNKRGALSEMVQSLGVTEGEQLRQTCQALWQGDSSSKSTHQAAN
eukprot:scpid4992/ scgid1440/ Multidrug resistance-associated protein 4; ATP-binding cassette sub-family C member 4; MRP/cMOAT-related ABC transporter; Multi-specific organic anion transporter B